MVPFVETPRILTRPAAAPAESRRNVVMKGVSRRLHPRIPRYGSRFIAGVNPIATMASVDNIAGPDPQTARQTVNDASSQ